MYLVPHMESIVSLVFLIAAVSALAGWVAAGSERIAYGGLQIALAFFMCVLQGFAPDTDFDKIRDRLVGIVLGIVVTTLVFRYVWPEGENRNEKPLNAMNAAYLSAMAALDRLCDRRLHVAGDDLADPARPGKIAATDPGQGETGDAFFEFIDEASVLYADAFTHEGTDLSKLSGLYAMISRMRLLVVEHIVEHAEKVSHLIIETYLAPNKTFRDVVMLKESGALDPMKEFSEACREELRKFG